LCQIDGDFHYRHEPAWVGEAAERATRVQVTTRRHVWPWLELGLIGEHQARNAAVAVAAVDLLRDEGLTIPDVAVKTGLASVRWPARLEIVGRRPLVLLDCAHNVASAQALAEALTTSFQLAAPAHDSREGRPRRHLIFAGSRDKDLAGMLRVLGPLFDSIYFTQYAHRTRNVPPQQLAELPAGPAIKSQHATAPDAWRAARTAAGPNDLICITGSVFLAGELRPTLLGA
jgi:dihydrofolate synthase/folylpolyglutamate synthase